jgi:hypothetical protein
MSDGADAAKPHPLNDADRVFVLETLRQEAMELFSQQRAIADKGARALALGATVLAGFAAYGIAGTANGHELLLRALPVALALIGIELGQNFIAESAMGRARMAIEDALARHLGLTVLVYDRYVRFRGRDTTVSVVVALVFLVLYAGVVYLTQVPDAPSGKDAIESSGTIVSAARIATVVTGGALLVVIVASWVEEKRGSAPVQIEIPPNRGDSRD